MYSASRHNSEYWLTTRYPDKGIESIIKEGIEESQLINPRSFAVVVIKRGVPDALFPNFPPSCQLLFEKIGLVEQQNEMGVFEKLVGADCRK